MDAIPTQWGGPRQHSRIDLASAAAHFFDGVPKIATVGQDDRCGDEVEGSRAGLLVLQATVAKATEPMEGDQIGRAPSELQSLMRISYAVFCLKQNKKRKITRLDRHAGYKV